jgi:DNA-directed RNA polymerase specialized sigma24 family protein
VIEQLVSEVLGGERLTRSARCRVRRGFVNAHPALLGPYLRHYQPRGGAWRQWQGTEPTLQGHDFVSLRALLLDRTCSPERKDDLLGALVRIGQTPGPARTEARFALLACLLPGLRRIASSCRDALGDDEVWAELGLAAWLLLDRYDLDRRPHRIAANILWDTRAQVLKAVRRERHWERTVELDDSRCVHLTKPEPMSSSQGLIEAVAIGLLSRPDATLIEATRLNGLQLDEVAVLLGISYEAAKKRRRRAEVAWASWWAPERQTLNALPGQATTMAA